MVDCVVIHTVGGGGGPSSLINILCFFVIEYIVWYYRLHNNILFTALFYSFTIAAKGFP